MKKTIIAKGILGIFLVLCFLFSPLTPGIDYRAEAATVSEAQDKVFDEFQISIGSEKETAKVGNKRVGYYWAASARSGNNYTTSYYYSKTKSGKGKVIFTKKFDYYDYFEGSFGVTHQNADIYTNGKTCYFIYDTEIYYGSVGKKVKKISKVSEDFYPEDVFMVYDNKLYYSCYSEYSEDSGKKWDNDRPVVSQKNYVYNPKVGKPKRVMLKYKWIGTTGRYLFCHYFSKIEPGEWATLWGSSEPYQKPDYPVYDESKVRVYDCKTGKFVKTLTGESFGLGSREFEERLDLWSEEYDDIREYPEDYLDSEGRILFQAQDDKLILKARDTVVIADQLGNVIKTIPNIKGYLYLLNNEDDMFATVYGTMRSLVYDYVCPESIRIYDYEGSVLGKAEIEEGQALIDLTKDYAYTMPFEPTTLDNGNFKLTVSKYDLKSGNNTTVLNTNALGSSDVKKAFMNKGKIGYLSLESLCSTKNYFYWSAKYGMYAKYDPHIFGDAEYVPETVFYRLDKKTKKIKKISKETYDKAVGKTNLIEFDEYLSYITGSPEYLWDMA